MFFTSTPCQPSPIFATNAKCCLSGAPILGQALALLTNIRLGWKGLPVTNTPVYFGHRRREKKSFLKHWTGQHEKDFVLDQVNDQTFNKMTVF